MTVLHITNSSAQAIAQAGTWQHFASSARRAEGISRLRFVTGSKEDSDSVPIPYILTSSILPGPCFTLLQNVLKREHHCVLRQQRAKYRPHGSQKADHVVQEAVERKTTVYFYCSPHPHQRANASVLVRAIEQPIPCGTPCYCAPSRPRNELGGHA